MGEHRILDIPLNRAEGDLEIRVEVADGVVVDAWSAGTMYRGIENLLVGRGSRDGLVITPRICGICSTTHLTAAVRALDAVAGVAVPADATRLRNVALMAEHIQSDVRQAVLMYLVDFAVPAYRSHPLHDEAVARYAPLRGTSCIETLKETKGLLEIIGLIGGQWPHSAFMVPGGVVHAPGRVELMRCRQIVRDFRSWYERKILGCSLERWRQVRTAADLDAWTDENAAQRDGEVGFFLRFSRQAGLGGLGRGYGHFLSFGALDLPADTRVQAPTPQLVASGFVQDGVRSAFDPKGIAEHIASSWFEGYEGGLHPFEGLTRPYASGPDGGRYSWAKAPRYQGIPAETGPLAEFLVGGDPLFTGLVGTGGADAVTRELARLVRPATLLDALDAWLEELLRADTVDPYSPPGEIPDGQGAGLTQAARGALGHWVTISEGRIEHYQIITPTAWNASPRDSGGVRGPWEEALVGTPIPDPEDVVAVGHVIRSFDPCLVCSVHAVRKGQSLGRAILRA